MKLWKRSLFLKIPRAFASDFILARLFILLMSYLIPSQLNELDEYFSECDTLIKPPFPLREGK